MSIEKSYAFLVQGLVVNANIRRIAAQPSHMSLSSDEDTGGIPLLVFSPRLRRYGNISVDACLSGTISCGIRLTESTDEVDRIAAFRSLSGLARPPPMRLGRCGRATRHKLCVREKRPR